MLVVHTTVPVDPERREEALAEVESLVERSRAEDGAIAYSAAVDLADRSVLRFVERYEDEAALAAHARTDHYREFVAALPDLVDGPVETTRFAVDDAETTRLDAADLRRLGD